MNGSSTHGSEESLIVSPAISSGNSAPISPSSYPVPTTLPTQRGTEGIRFDFNQGCRVHLPEVEQEKATWRVELKDLDTGNILFAQGGLKQAFVRSSKRWYVRFSIIVWQDVTSDDDKVTSRTVFSHVYDATQKQILIVFPVGTLGDTLAWLPYATRFAVVRQAHVICAMSELLIPLFKDAYPDITFVTHDKVRAEKLTEQAYATYYLGLFFDDAACDWQPCDFRLVGLHKTAAYILGVLPDEEPAKISFPDEGRPIEEPYVCIAAQASSQAKYWNNPNGWAEVVSWLKAQGYRVICIDREKVHGTGIVWNHIPYGVEDQTGNRPLGSGLIARR